MEMLISFSSRTWHPAHTAKGTKSWFSDHGVTVAWLASKLAWPEPHRDLWSMSKRTMRDTRPNNADELKATVKATWASIPPQQVPQTDPPLTPPSPPPHTHTPPPPPAHHTHPHTHTHTHTHRIHNITTHNCDKHQSLCTALDWPHSTTSSDSLNKDCSLFVTLNRIDLISSLH